MRVAKAAVFAMALIAAIAIGVWIGPYLTHRQTPVADTTASARPSPAASADTSQLTRSAQRAPTRHRAKADMKATAANTSAPAEAGMTPKTLPAAAPALHARLKGVLNKGADMGIASEDFESAEQFVTLARAARNTEVPFMVLKHRVVYERKTLEEAIHEFKPDLDASAEVQRARTEAKSVIAELEG
jgi:hypothetical protein